MSSEDAAENPRVRARRSSEQLGRAVRDGRRVGEALTGLSARALAPDEADRALAHDLARFLVRRCSERHRGWTVLRQVLLDAGADVPWERCERQAVEPTAERVLRDCATPGRTPLVRVQHSAAQERVRAIAPHVDPGLTLRRLKVAQPRRVSAEAWSGALVEAVSARSREQAVRKLAAALGGDEAG